jgi:protein-ribulosamine 3-kinase
LNQQIPHIIKGRLEQKLNTTLKHFSPVSGGCINNGGQLITSKAVLFLKWNDKNRYPKMFDAEARGLRILSNTKIIHIPDIILYDEIGDFQILVLEWIKGKDRPKNFWENLGIQIARLHQNTQPFFGLDHDNYIGSLPQTNKKENSWIDFFINQRLVHQLELLSDQSLIKDFDGLFQKLPSLLPEEKPALLHGDLWSGNLIADENGAPCLIDPAVYYGNREIEIAFTHLFGGFSSDFYNSYTDASPLQPGFQDRIDLYNLYPLLVHVNLFGGGYLSQVKNILKKYC